MRYPCVVVTDRPRNPFSPTFGTTPPLLAGRDGVLRRFAEALDAAVEATGGYP